jgi:hypothetical protein
MTRSSFTAAVALIPALLLACGSEPETMSDEQIEEVLESWSEGGEAAPPAPAPTPGALDMMLPPMASAPEDLSDRFMVILASSDKPRHMAPSLSILAGHPDLLDDVVRANSSWFQGLMPCYEITVAGAFEYRRQATALARRLEELGVDNYVKQAGRYVGRQEVVEAWCHSGRKAADAGCGEARFVEVYDETAWMWLPQDPVVIQRALEGTQPPKPLGGLEAWSTPLSAETIEGNERGEGWKVYAPASGTEVGRCTIKGFEAITRGQPHFGYLQQDPAPGAPGCGEPEIFAKLSCKEPPTEPLLALPKDHEEPVLYMPLAPLRDIELEDDVKVIVAKSPAFGPTFQQARRDANERSMPLQQLVDLRGFVAPERKVLLVQVTLQTGDGEIWCGSDDVREVLAAVYEWNQDGGIGAELVPFHRLDLAEVLGLIDLDADGIPELFQRRWPNELQISRAGEMGCSAPQDYCDCPC